MSTNRIGIIGGSGFYSFLENVDEVDIQTPYGDPSDKLAIAEYNGKEVVFLPRHGKDHSVPPHKINYRANIDALKKCGVNRIISPTAAGSLQAHIKPGSFVIVDQFIDRTKKRIDTFYEEPPITHIPLSEPYCSELRKIAIDACSQHNVSHHDGGTVVVIEGPRFSSRAESKWFSSMGWEVINMTQYPEVVLAREAEMAFVNISLITDYDCGVEGVDPVSVSDMLGIFKTNMDNIRRVIFSMIDAIDPNKKNSADGSLKMAQFH